MSVKLGFDAETVYRRNVVDKKDVDLIAQWLKQKNLPTYSNEQIIQFLLSCDNLCDATKTTIESYVKITNSCDEVFSNKNVKRIELQKYLKVGEICVLPERTEDGCVILLNRLVDTNYKNYEMCDYFTILTMTIESALFDYPANGLIMIVDVTGTSWKHLLCLRVGLIRIFSHFLQEGLPVKLRKIFLINSAPILNKFMSIIRPFTKTEVMEKVDVYKVSEMKIFYEKCLPKRLLPLDYGGEMPSVKILHNNQIKKFENLVDYFEAEEKQRTMNV